IAKAGPSTPVQVLGLSEPPHPGTTFQTVKSEKVAREMIDTEHDAAADRRGVAGRTAITLEDVFAQVAAGEAKDLNLIVKVDVQGSLQPIEDSLKQIAKSNPEDVRLRVLSAEVGNITENDVMLAAASTG